MLEQPRNEQTLQEPDPGTPLVPEEPAAEQAPWSLQQTFQGVLLTIVPWLVLSIGLSSLAGGNTTRPTAPLPWPRDLAGAVVTVFFSLIIQSAFLIAPIYFARRAVAATTAAPPSPRKTLRALGFRGFRVPPVVFWLLLLLVGILIANTLYQTLITTLHLNLQTNDQVYLRLGKVAPITTYTVLFLAVFVAPFCEETFFRGFLFPGLRRGMAVGWAIMLSALVFAAVHADLASFPILALIGIALAFLRWRTRSIWPGMLLHMLNNAAGAIGILLYMHGVIR
ncbi:MAG: CPBP family intramembrane metalloprotease [Ktedonobacteraceae bacterium]|nr:CPBP family intramembrane metalloprotease [Ktedonobacteraceae bacterium]